ncbi:S1 family peptidase [Aurantiacibacter spongiae]|uniref:Serine protease n=1 Tax=Aurantiacibacter spongiae TaxID=2488860 RepID=A0A3N5D078_9SPHN|nr:serine protease [Aurantiacibacter spongiae]RPF72389.1 serine protease [Aurantiacibacter spongiae]
MRALLHILGLMLAALAMCPAPAGAEPADIEAAARGVVRVIIIGRDGEEIFAVSHGTGFAVGQERFVTNAHVVAEAIEDERLSIGIVPAEGGDAVYARLVAVSPRNDLALLETTERLGLPPLTIAANPAQSGSVAAIGYPMNVDRAQGLTSTDIFRPQPPVAATGFLSGRRPSREFDTLLHTAPIARGNSGGPLVDDCGRVVGVNSFGTDSEGSDAEFFFAVSTRELLPFLRANGVSPRLNAMPCRSLADLEAEEAARSEAQADLADARAREQAQALARQTEEARRGATYAVMQERDNGLALAVLLLFVALAAGGVAAYGHVRADMRMRAIAGGIAFLAFAGAAIAWFSRPAFAEIDTRLEDTLRARMSAADTGTIPDPGDATGTYQCVLDTQRSRAVGDPQEDMDIDWGAGGCINGRTQYGLAGGRWTRVFVPANEAAVSVNRFDPAQGQFIMERYLLDREAMTGARAARGKYNAPDCGAPEAAAQRLGSDQAAVMSSLPPRPNERLVYDCTATGD